MTDDGGKSDTATMTITVTPDDDGDGISPPADCNDDDDNAIYPGASDPVGDSIDQDCDGADGVAADTIFVSSSGADGRGCGTTAVPCATIAYGIGRATSTGDANVHVQAGSYAGVLRRHRQDGARRVRIGVRRVRWDHDCNGLAGRDR